jgi:hypothetical protein
MRVDQTHLRGAVPILFAALGVAACANDPAYIPAPMTMEAGMIDTTGMPTVAKASLQLPVKTETASDMTKRTALADKLGIEVPYVRLGDMEIEIEWTIHCLDTAACLDPKRGGHAKIELNGANEFFSYDPSIIMLDPGNDEAPPTPGLSGDIPIDVVGITELSGLFTEDQLREASIDLDQITRGHLNPFRAMLTISKNAPSFQPLTPQQPPATPGAMPPPQLPMGNPIPREAFAGMTRIDLVFKPDTHMALDYTVRIRDVRGLLHDLLLTAVIQKPGELQTFMPMVYNPTPAGP